MNFIGDYFAFVLVLVLCIFFLDKKHLLSKISRFFVVFLILTAATSLIDILTGTLMARPETPNWVNIGINSLYFVINILSTSCAAIYLFNRILEHSHDKHCLRYAMIGLSVCFTVYLIFVISNIWNGCMFYFDDQNNYCRGPLNAIGYWITVAQMVLVLICLFPPVSTLTAVALYIVLAYVIPEETDYIDV